MRSRSFVRLLIAQAVSDIGDGLLKVALPFLLLRRFESAAVLSVVLATNYAAYLVCGPLASPLADRWNRKGILVASDLVRACLTATIPFLTTLPQLTTVFLLMNAITALFRPTRASIVPEIVPQEDYASAVALSQAVLRSTAMLSPAVGALLAAAASVDILVITDAVTFAASAALLATVQAPRPGNRGGWSYLEDLKAGFAFLWNETLLRQLITMTGLLYFGWAATNIVVPSYFRYAGFSVSDYGGLLSINGLGALAGVFMAGVLDRMLCRAVLLRIGHLVWGASLLIASMRPGLLYMLGLWGAMGLAEGLWMVGNNTYFAYLTPNHIRGRVYAAANTLTTLAALVVTPGVGLAADRFGFALTLAASGVAVSLGLCLLRDVSGSRSKSRGRASVYQ